MTRRAKILLVAVLVAVLAAVALPSPAMASYCPHHDFKRNGGYNFYDYMGHKNGRTWHKHYYNKFAWNGARYVFVNGIIRYCYRVDIAGVQYEWSVDVVLRDPEAVAA